LALAKDIAAASLPSALARELLGLPADGFLEVILGAADAPHHAQVGVGMHRLGVGRGAEELRHLGVALIVGLLREGQVLAVGLRFAGERLLEIVHGAHFNLLSNCIRLTNTFFPDRQNIMQAKQG